MNTCFPPPRINLSSIENIQFYQKYIIPLASNSPHYLKQIKKAQDIDLESQLGQLIVSTHKLNISLRSTLKEKIQFYKQNKSSGFYYGFYFGSFVGSCLQLFYPSTPDESPVTLNALHYSFPFFSSTYNLLQPRNIFGKIVEFESSGKNLSQSYLQEEDRLYRLLQQLGFEPNFSLIGPSAHWLQSFSLIPQSNHLLGKNNLFERPSISILNSPLFSMFLFNSTQATLDEYKPFRTYIMKLSRAINSTLETLSYYNVQNDIFEKQINWLNENSENSVFHVANNFFFGFLTGICYRLLSIYIHNRSQRVVESFIDIDQNNPKYNLHRGILAWGPDSAGNSLFDFVIGVLLLFLVPHTYGCHFTLPHFPVIPQRTFPERDDFTSLYIVTKYLNSE